jgi:hypothetical protein
MERSHSKLPYFLVFLLAPALIQTSDAFITSKFATLGMLKTSIQSQNSHRFSLSCALTSDCPKSQGDQNARIVDRRYALGTLATAATFHLQPVRAAEENRSPTPKSAESNKLVGLSNEKLKNMVEADIRDRQFLVTGQLTRYSYSIQRILTHLCIQRDKITSISGEILSSSDFQITVRRVLHFHR